MEKLRFWRSCGFLLRLSLLWEQNFVLFPPFLFVYAITGSLEAALDNALLSSVAPSLSKRLITWPPNVSIDDDGVRHVDLGEVGKDPRSLVQQVLEDVSLSNSSSSSLLISCSTFTNQTLFFDRIPQSSLSRTPNSQNSRPP